jgi:hypothetical protein
MDQFVSIHCLLFCLRVAAASWLVIGITFGGPAVKAADPDAEVVAAIAQLASPQFAEREAASSQLARAGGDAIGPLVAAAQGADPEVAVRAVEILRDMLSRDDTELVDRVEKALEVIAAKGSLAVAQQAEVALDFYGVVQDHSAREILEQLGATFSAVGLQGERIEIAADWKGDSKSLRLITRLRDIRHVSLYRVQLTERDAATLGRLRNVEQIDLFGVGMDQEVLAQLRRWLPEVEIDVRRGGKLGIAGSPLPGQCIVSGIQVGSAAEKAGLQPQDIIKEINGQAVADFDACTKMIGEHGPGEKVSLLVERPEPAGKVTQFRREVILGGW